MFEFVGVGDEVADEGFHLIDFTFTGGKACVVLGDGDIDVGVFGAREEDGERHGEIGVDFGGRSEACAVGAECDVGEVGGFHDGGEFFEGDVAIEDEVVEVLFLGLGL